MTYNAIMRWGIYVVAATSVLAGTSCLRARAASDTHMACGATLAVPEPIRLSILPVQTGHKWRVPPLPQQSSRKPTPANKILPILTAYARRGRTTRTASAAFIVAEL
jgi:hypothetical protein